MYILSVFYILFIFNINAKLTIYSDGMATGKYAKTL